MYQKIKHYLKNFLQEKAPRLLVLIHKYKIVIKYGISGGTAVAANLAVIYIFTEIFSLWYVASSIFAFLVAIVIGFFMHKYWTFRDNSMHRIKRQMALYLAVGLLNLVLGPALLFTLVEMFGIWYLFGQVLVMAILAVGSYFVNRFITFKKEKIENIIEDNIYESIDN